MAPEASRPSIVFSALADGIHATNPLRTDRFDIKGISWFGAEGSSACPDGLWQRTAAALLDDLEQLRFNAVRLPLAVDNVLNNPDVDKWSVTANPEFRGLRSLEIVERLVRMAATRGLLIMLDMHRLIAAVWPTAHGLWHDPDPAAGLPASRLEAAWRKLARQFCGHWNVFAADLFNEPHGASWGDGDEARDWSLYAGKLGDLVLSECPRWLVLVEGIGVGAADYYCEPATSWSGCFWGENLMGLAKHGGPRISTPNRLVYSPHLYGPGTNSKMFYFNRTAFPEFPANLPSVWATHFLEPARAIGATLMIGEWGGRYVGADKEWQDQLKSIVMQHRLSNFYWALNPNSGDTGGILLDDWSSPHEAKQQMLSELPSSNARLALASTPAFDCSASEAPREVGSVANGLFRCGDANGFGVGPRTMKCIHASQACNGVFECGDRSDERKAACRAVEARTQPCVTVGGQDPLRPCVLPFVYRGVRFESCALDDAIDGKAWCPTAVTHDDHGLGHYESFASWGVCGPGCDREAGRKLQADGCEPSRPEPHIASSIDTLPPGRRSEEVPSRKRDGPGGVGGGGRGGDGSGGGIPRGGDGGNDEQDGWSRPLPPLPVHCAPPPSPPPSPPSPPPGMPPPLAPPPWTLADAPPLLILLGGTLLLLVAAATAIAARRASTSLWRPPSPEAFAGQRRGSAARERGRSGQRKNRSGSARLPEPDEDCESPGPYSERDRLQPAAVRPSDHSRRQRQPRREPRAGDSDSD